MSITLFSMIQNWAKVSIEKCQDEDNVDFLTEPIKEMRSKFGTECTLLSFAGSNGPLFGSGYLIALDKDGNIIHVIETYIS